MIGKVGERFKVAKLQKEVKYFKECVFCSVLLFQNTRVEISFPPSLSSAVQSPRQCWVQIPIFQNE